MTKKMKGFLKKCGVILCTCLFTFSMTMTAWATSFSVESDGTNSRYYVDDAEVSYDTFSAKFKEVTGMDYETYAKDNSSSGGSGNGSGTGSGGQSAEGYKTGEYNQLAGWGYEYVSIDEAKSRIYNCMNNGSVSSVNVFYESGEDLSSYIEAQRGDGTTWTSYYKYSGGYSWSIGGGGYYSYVTVERVVQSQLVISDDQQSALNGKVSSVASTIGGSTADKISGAYSYLCKNVTYDYGYSRHNPYQALVENNSVCEGYATAFQLLMENLGVESYIVTGTIDGVGHAWNAVNCDGVYYYVDATFGATSGMYDLFKMFGTDVRSNITSLPIADHSYDGSSLGNNSVQINSDGSAVVVDNDTGETVIEESSTDAETKSQETSESTEEQAQSETDKDETADGTTAETTSSGMTGSLIEQGSSGGSGGNHQTVQSGDGNKESDAKHSSGIPVLGWVAIGIVILGGGAGGIIFIIQKKKWKKI